MIYRPPVPANRSIDPADHVRDVSGPSDIYDDPERFARAVNKLRAQLVKPLPAERRLDGSDVGSGVSAAPDG